MDIGYTTTAYGMGIDGLCFSFQIKTHGLTRMKQKIISANVFSLCVRAGLKALSCQPAPMPNRSTKD